MGGKINYYDGKPTITAAILMNVNKDDKDSDNVVNVNWIYL